MKYKDYIEKFLSEMESAQRDGRWFASSGTMDWAYLKRQQKAFLRSKHHGIPWPDKLEVDICQAAVFIGNSVFPDLLPEEERETYPLRRAFQILWNCIRYGTDRKKIPTEKAIPTANGPLPIVNLSDVVRFMEDLTPWRATQEQLRKLAELQGESDSSSPFLGEKGKRRVAILSLWDKDPNEWLCCDEVYCLLGREYERDKKTIQRDLHDLAKAGLLKMNGAGRGRLQSFTKSGDLPNC